jgi:hypothetical protein
MTTDDRATVGSGWIVFSAIVLGMAGIMRIFDAIWAWTYNGPVSEGLQDALFGNDLNTYGWIYFFVGIILLGSAILVVGGSQMARWIGVVAAVIGTVSAIWWMPYYPLWSLTYVFLGTLVIYGLIAHGSRDEVLG